MKKDKKIFEELLSHVGECGQLNHQKLDIKKERLEEKRRKKLFCITASLLSLQ